MPLGFFSNFPAYSHYTETFNSAISTKQLQQRLIQLFVEINKKEYTFEETSIPTIPGCKVIFEFGLADSENFDFIDKEEEEKALKMVANEQLRTLDFFCVIRYYKGERQTALKFDYYFLRTIYGQRSFEVQVFHKSGPRYMSPEDLTEFIIKQTNEDSGKKIIRKNPL